MHLLLRKIFLPLLQVSLISCSGTDWFGLIIFVKMKYVPSLNHVCLSQIQRLLTEEKKLSISNVSKRIGAEGQSSAQGTSDVC